MMIQNDHETAAPTTRDPWTATLLWAKGQNRGMVSTFPNRTPVHAIVSRLVAGESFAEVAADFDIPVETVHISWQLHLDLRGITG